MIKMNFKITDKIKKQDEEIIYQGLSDYNLARIEDRNPRDLGICLQDETEETAKERGCKYAFLDTFSFQAPAFYEKHGYRNVFALEEYPVTGKCYYFTKTL
jgi:ribosomal protein S18 acetylase RimI-like enzyme